MNVNGDLKEEKKVAEMLFEWKTGHYPDKKLSELAREWHVDFSKIGLVPYDTSRGRELTWQEIKDQQDKPYGEKHIEWRKPWEVQGES